MTPDRDAELGARESAVLRAIVRDHLLAGEPVGSQRVAELSQLGLSPASIRSIMARLEREGFLEQPHTSAGRVPTDRAYRRIVGEIARSRHRVPHEAAQRVESALARHAGEMPELLLEASHQLSVLSHQAGVVLAPALRRVPVERLQFVRLDARRVTAIVVGRTGGVHHRTLVVPEAPGSDELERIGVHLSACYSGFTLPEIRAALAEGLAADRETVDRLQSQSLALCTAALDADLAEVDVFVEGLGNLLVAREFGDLDVVRALLRALEQKRMWIGLVDRLIEAEGVQVMIGDDNPLCEVARCAVVASSWGGPGDARGSLAIVGPVRMEYSRVIPLVEYLARALSERLDPARD